MVKLNEAPEKSDIFVAYTKDKVSIIKLFYRKFSNYFSRATGIIVTKFHMIVKGKGFAQYDCPWLSPGIWYKKVMIALEKTAYFNLKMQTFALLF